MFESSSALNKPSVLCKSEWITFSAIPRGSKSAAVCP
jgi:hypothetical protein